jgi:glycosyltransferase involved in cell wall biosynthesis
MSAAFQVTFTVLLPVHRPPALLPYAIASVLAQAREDFELVVICDGAPADTVECARAAAARDRRIQVRAHPKGERNGEAYRHQALAQARGRFVCQIADDDLWFPDHLDEMERLLVEFEFGNLPSIIVRPDGELHLLFGDLGHVPLREAMRKSQHNFFSPSAAGYRLAAYRRLPLGWAPAPQDVWSDLHMWRKFLALPDLCCGTRVAFTGLHFPASARRDWPLEKRAAELRDWSARVADAKQRDAIVQQLLRSMIAAELAYRRRRAESAAS